MLLYDYIKQPVKLSSQLSQVQAQDRPTLKALVESINDSKDSETRILLAKSLLNFPMFSEEDQNYENATIYYINMIKIIVRELSTEMLNTLFDAETQDFPILRSLMQYTHHCDVMIQNAARLGLLTIFKKSQGQVLEYVNNFVIPKHFGMIISFLNETVLNLKKSIENRNIEFCNIMCQRYVEQLEYVDDILCLEQKSISDNATLIFLKDFVVKFIFLTVETRHVLNHKKKSTFTEINLLLLGKLMKTITNKQLKEHIIKYLLPFDLKDASIDKTSIKTIVNVRNTIRTILRCMQTNKNLLYILGILYIVSRSLNDWNDLYGIFVFYKSYMKLLQNHFLKDNVKNNEVHILKLNIITSILSEIATTLLRNNGPFWLLIKDDYLIRIKELYLNICENLEYSDTLKFSSQIDESYKKWMKNQKPDIFSVCFLSDQEFECKISKDSRKEDLLKLLYVRYLCLQTSNRKEKILPILPPKLQNGQSLLVKNYIFCKIVGQKTKRTQSNIVILTSSQVLVLEHSKDQRGTVIFSCFYKDLMWSECKQNHLLLWEDCENKNPKLNNQQLNVPKILLEFGKNDDREMIVKTLPHAKIKQHEIIQRKIDDLLELEVRKGRLKYGMK